MNAGLVAIMWLIIAAGVGVGCWASYRQGRLNGYDAGRKAEHNHAEAKINAICRTTAQEVNALKQRGHAAQTTIDYLYDRAQSEVEQLGRKPASADGAEQP